jgi:hypothetical protein
MRWGDEIRLAALILLFAPASAHASSCVKPVTEKIKFAKNAACWTYEGKATHFVGRFAAGQKLTVTMSGVLTEYDEKTRKTVATWAARVPSVNGPQDFSVEGDFEKSNGKLELIVPRDGNYRFGFFPCAMWHNPGKVQICAAQTAKPSSN